MSFSERRRRDCRNAILKGVAAFSVSCTCGIWSISATLCLMRGEPASPVIFLAFPWIGLAGLSGVLFAKARLSYNLWQYELAMERLKSIRPKP